MRPKEITASTQVAAFLLAVTGFAALAAAYVTNDPLVRLDAEVAIAFHENVTPPATALLAAITSLGSTSFLAVVTALAAGWLAGRGSRPDAVLLVAAFAGSQAVTWALKASFRRERPSFDEPVASASSFSFPSGHALASLAVYGALVYVLARRSGSARVVTAALAVTTLLVAVIGFSRIYLGVHYLSDVLAGYSAGLALLLVTIGGVRMCSRVDLDSAFEYRARGPGRTCFPHAGAKVDDWGVEQCVRPYVFPSSRSSPYLRSCCR